MTSILPFLKGQAVFDPEDTQAMSVAFEEVCRALKVNGNERDREVIASRIIELAHLMHADA